MSYQYLCDMSRLDTSHIIHQVFITDGNGEIQRVQALIDCCTTSVCMALRLRKWLGLADEPAYVTTLGFNSQVMAHVSDS